MSEPYRRWRAGRAHTLTDGVEMRGLAAFQRRSAVVICDLGLVHQLNIARIAQLVEHITDTDGVLGSNPSTRTKGGIKDTSSTLGKWRNWYTRTPQKRILKGLRVRVPPCPLFV